MPKFMNESSVLGWDDDFMHEHEGPISLLIEGQHERALKHINPQQFQQLVNLFKSFGLKDMKKDYGKGKPDSFDSMADICDALPRLDEQQYTRYINLMASFAGGEE